MQVRFIKDFVVAMIVILLLAYGIRLYSVYIQSNQVPEQSKHTEEAVSDTLLNKIKTIENSIQDRKSFVFNNLRDPLRQGNIIKDRFDLAKEFEQMVLNTFRPTGTYIDQDSGKRMVNVEFQGRILSGGINDVLEGRRITWINEDSIGIYYGGPQTLAIEKRPPTPDFSQQDAKSNLQNY